MDSTAERLVPDASALFIDSRVVPVRVPTIVVSIVVKELLMLFWTAVKSALVSASTLKSSYICLQCIDAIL